MQIIPLTGNDILLYFHKNCSNLEETVGVSTQILAYKLINMYFTVPNLPMYDKDDIIIIITSLCEIIPKQL